MLDASSLLDFLKADVFNDMCATVFWLGSPFNLLCQRSMTRVNRCSFEIIYESLLRGANIERTSCNVHAILKHHCSQLDKEELLLACKILSFCVQKSVGRSLLHDPSLFRKLSERMTENNLFLLAIVNVFLDGEIFDVHSAVVAVENVGRMFVFTRIDNHHAEEHVQKSILLYENISKDVRWHDFICKWVCDLWRQNWPLAFVNVLSNMLGTESVQFIIELARLNKLNILIRAANKEDSNWKRVKDKLRQKWPLRVSEVLNDSSTVQDAEATSVCCPITQSPCVNPVVASDGHTYEKDAIMQHMSCCLKSPITKQPLTYFLFENYSIYS